MLFPLVLLTKTIPFLGPPVATHYTHGILFFLKLLDVLHDLLPRRLRSMGPAKLLRSTAGNGFLYTVTPGILSLKVLNFLITTLGDDQALKIRVHNPFPLFIFT